MAQSKGNKEETLQFRKLMNTIPDLISIHDENFNIVYSNWNGFGAVPEEMRKLQEKCYKVYRGLEDVCPDCRVKSVFQTGEHFQDEVELPNGQWVDLRIIPIKGEDGSVELVTEWVRDITKRKEAEKRILYMSYHDSLTGLYNREFLDVEMKRLDTERQLPISIIMADLDGLKLINDSYGHTKGDALLKAVTNILKASLREEDLISRWGGDEFLIFLPQTRAETVIRICERIEKNIETAQLGDIPISLTLGAATKKTSDVDLATALRAAEEEMHENKLVRSESARSAVVNSLLKTLRVKSYETEQHSQTIKSVSLKIGEKLGLNRTELNRLQLLSSLHDIGKINISENILLKKGPLTEDEWKEIKKHPATGWRIAKSTDAFVPVAEGILSHHERWDGKGYPRKLKAHDIPLLARIVAIADAYEVMKEGRPYQKPKTKEEIIAEFNRCAGSQFDPNLVKTFLSILNTESIPQP